MLTAIIMAGGRSSRMRASFGCDHKALVKILGMTMLERNLVTLLAHGVQKIFIAISAQETVLLDFARGRATQLARAGNAELKVFVEKQPLGTIGAARAIRTSSDDLLVVNVDNLTTLDLSAFLQHHRVNHAAMTVATHTEPFKVPFGQVSIRSGRIVDYKEKPVLPVILSSGTYVLSRRARSRIPLGEAAGAPDLVRSLLREKQRVQAFPHSSPWIDVNDSQSIDRAEALIMEHSSAFELWPPRPQRTGVVLCIVTGKNAVAVLKSRRSGKQSLSRHFPVSYAIPHDPSGERTAATIQAKADLPHTEKLCALTTFDELGTATGARTRYQVFVAHLGSNNGRRRDKALCPIRWVRVDQLSAVVHNSHADTRTVAYLRRYIASQNSHSVGH
jgi:NDP-mannose synthase